jgi:hypothetical protein
MNAERERVLYPSRGKLLRLLAMTAGFTALGVWLGLSGKGMGWVTAACFGLGVVVFAVQLLPGSAYLKLGPDGFVTCTMFRAHSRRWSDVDRFEAGRIGLNRMVVFDFAPGYARSAAAREAAAGLTGWEGALPDTYGMPAEELAELMNRYKAASEAA